MKRACFGTRFEFQRKIHPGVRDDLILFSCFALDKSKAEEKSVCVPAASFPAFEISPAFLTLHFCYQHMVRTVAKNTALAF